jgi:hypothetical protein
MKIAHHTLRFTGIFLGLPALGAPGRADTVSVTDSRGKAIDRLLQMDRNGKTAHDAKAFGKP